MATTPLHITPALDVLLRGTAELPVGLYHLHLTTAAQLTRLHYSPGSLKAIKKRLKLLADHGFVQADAKLTRRGNGGYYYRLDTAGMRYLEQAQYAAAESWRASQQLDKSSYFIDHTLEVNDVLIAALLLRRTYPAYGLGSFTHERDFKRYPFKVAVAGKAVTLIPDGFLDFYATAGGQTYRRPLLLEHDRGTEDQAKFRRKIRAYAAFLKSGAYRQPLGVKAAMSVAFSTFEGEKRAEKMREWAAAELTASHDLPNLGMTFWFAHLPKTPTPEEAWLQPRWRPALAAQGAQGDHAATALLAGDHAA